MEREKSDKFYDARLGKRLERDHHRWENEAKKEEREEHIRLKHQKVLIENKRNSNGIGYNPITQTYEESERGKKL